MIQTNLNLNRRLMGKYQLIEFDLDLLEFSNEEN